MLWLGVRSVRQQGLLIAGKIGTGTAMQRIGGAGKAGRIEGIQGGKYQHKTVHRFALFGVLVRQQQFTHGTYAIARA
ncbi:hypothetical protein D3C71_2010340 [compost metagenome]